MFITVYFGESDPFFDVLNIYVELDVLNVW